MLPDLVDAVFINIIDTNEKWAFATLNSTYAQALFLEREASEKGATSHSR